MMTPETDARDVSCPRPVIMAKQAYEEARCGDPVVVLVSRETQASNVERALLAMGAASVDTNEEQDPEGRSIFRVSTVREQLRSAGADAPGLLTVFVSSASWGLPPLGEKLLASALASLEDSSLDPPHAVVLVNKGVTLCVEGSPFLDLLERLQADGCRVLVCSESLASYGLEGHNVVGEPVRPTVLTSLLRNGRVVTLG